MPPIPRRAQTLAVLRLMGRGRPMLMLPGDDDGYGCRWLLDGGEVPPAIAKYLMDTACIADVGATEFGARTLVLTDSGLRLREDGRRWWANLGLLQRLWVIVLG